MIIMLYIPWTITFSVQPWSYKNDPRNVLILKVQNWPKKKTIDYTLSWKLVNNEGEKNFH